MPQYEVLRSHGAGGGKFLEPGDVVDLDRQEGTWRTGIGLVQPVPVAPPAAAAPPPLVAAELPAAVAPLPEVPAAAPASPPPAVQPSTTSSPEAPARGSKKA